jgi:hypothetical protein
LLRLGLRLCRTLLLRLLRLGLRRTLLLRLRLLAWTRLLLLRLLGLLLLRHWLLCFRRFLLLLLLRRLGVGCHAGSGQRHRADDGRRDERPVQHVDAHFRPVPCTEVVSCPDDDPPPRVCVRAHVATRTSRL